MKFEEVIVLLPCHSLEDFPTHYEGVEAEGLLSSWSCLWHPALLAATEKLPSWYRADAPPDDLSNRLLIIPSSSESLLLAGWVARAKSEGAVVVRKQHRREEMIAAALAQLDGGDGGVDADLAADFIALGSTFLWVELLTRQMRYMSNVDETHLKNEAVAGAQAALAKDTETARRHLQNCFDTLLEARERFYPVQAYLIDLTLVAPTTVGASLRGELDQGCPVNLLLSGQTLDTLAASEPATLERLKLALDHRSAAVVGGEYSESELPLLPIEHARNELVRGLDTYQRLLQRRPSIYGRRRFGLTPILPQLLSRAEFTGALHLTLDDGQFPQSHQCKTRWEGLDNSAIDALCRLPLDAKAPETFLGLSRKIGETMDSDHVATIVFAHWPGDASPFYADLRRMANYTPALGKFITLDDYFSQTDAPGDTTRFQADQYRAPYLKQSVIRKQSDPLSKIASQHAASARAGNESALETFAKLLSRDSTPENSTPLATLARVVAPPGGKHRAVVVVNPANFPRTEIVDISALPSLPAIQGAVKGVQSHEGKKLALVEVPACGFARVTPETSAAPVGKPPKPMVDGLVLKNEYFNLTVHEQFGGIRSLYVPEHRGNRLSMQLAFRLPQPRPQPGDLWRDPDEDAQYSVMAVDEIKTTATGPIFGEIQARGRLLDLAGKKLADYQLAYRLVRGSRRMEIRGQLAYDEPPRPDPWQSYYAMRFAWPEAAPDLWRSVALTAQPTSAKRIESPDFLELRSERARLSLYPHGLPYHRYNGLRMLDTLLAVRGETQTAFRIDVGLDIGHPSQEALAMYEPLSTFAVDETSANSDTTGWWFHVDAKNLVATHWQPVMVDGKVTGFTVRLLETEGKAGRAHLRCFTPPRSARQVDLLGRKMLDLALDGDRAVLEVSPYEWFEAEVTLW